MLTLTNAVASIGSIGTAPTSTLTALQPLILAARARVTVLIAANSAILQGAGS